MSTPKAFYSYLENEDKLNMLSDEQAGRLYKALYAYSRTGERPDMSDDPLLNYALVDFLIDVDRDRQKYEQTCIRRAEAGKKGGRPKVAVDEKANGLSEKAKKANGFSKKQAKANESKKSETEAEAEAEDNIASAILSKGACPDFERQAVEVIELFKTVCTSFVQPGKLTEYRKRLIFQAMTEGVDFDVLFKKAQSSAFLTGSSGIGFDWLLTPKNRQKVIEGNYDDKKKPPDKRGTVFSTEGASFDVSKYEGSGLYDD